MCVTEVLQSINKALWSAAEPHLKPNPSEPEQLHFFVSICIYRTSSANVQYCGITKQQLILHCKMSYTLTSHFSRNTCTSGYSCTYPILQKKKRPGEVLSILQLASINKPVCILPELTQTQTPVLC